MGRRGTHLKKGQTSRTRFKMNTVYKEFFGYAKDPGSMMTRQQKKGECLVLHGEETSILQLRSHFLQIVTSRTCSLVCLFVCLFVCFVFFFCFCVSLSYKHANVASQSNLFTLALKREKNTAS